MKTFLSVLFTFLSISMFAQTNALGKMSQGKFLDSAVIYDNEIDNVFGYALLYQKDKLENSVFELEYVILDNNLNKISSTSVKQKSFSSAYPTRFSLVNKNKDEVILGISEVNPMLEFAAMPPVNFRYLTFNTKTLAFSDDFYFDNNQKLKADLNVDSKLPLGELFFRQNLITTEGDNYILFDFIDNKNIPMVVIKPDKFINLRKSRINGFTVLDKDFNTVWRYSYNENTKKSYDEYELVSSSKETLVMLKTVRKKKPIRSIEIFSLKDGSIIQSIPFTDNSYNFRLKRLDDNGANYDLIFALYKLKEKEYLDSSILGYYKLSINKKTGNQVSKNYLTWVDLKAHFNFKKPEKSGQIVKSGSLLLRDFISLKSGKYIGVFEDTKIKKKNDYFKDYYFIEFDNTLKVSNITKHVNEEQIDVKYNRFRTYRFSQKLNSNDEYVFFYETIEKENKKNVHKLVITTYLNNQFSQEKLPLSDKDSKIYPSLAKNGYILLLEHDKKGNAVEQRLEKINL
nr:DUF6770 family protein [uncultured Flavobacterium sp.]